MNNSSDYKRVFNHFDEDQNGMISPTELHHRIGLISHDNVSIEDVKAVVQTCNNNNGELGFEDFVSLIESYEKEDEKVEDLKKVFRMYYENDETECITPKSLNRMLGRLGESTSVDECVGMISMFDLNGDGMLNFDEFKAMML